MTNLQKISLFFALFVLLGKSQVLGGCGSSKAASSETADTTDPSRLYRTQPAQKSQEQRQSDTVSGTQTKSQLNLTQTKDVQSGGAGAGATAPVQHREPSKNKPAKEEESIKAPLKEKPTIEGPSNGRKNPIIQPPPRSKKEAAIKRRGQKRQELGAQTRASHQTVKPSQPVPPRRAKKKPQVATVAGSRNGTQPSSQRQGKPRVAFAIEGEGAGKRPVPLQERESKEKGGLTKKKQKLPPLRIAKKVEELPQEAQQKQALLITVSPPGDVRTDAAQSTNTVLKPAGVKPLQSEQDKTTAVAVAPLNASQKPRLKAEEEPKLTPRSPKNVPLVLEKPTEPIQKKVGELPELALDLPGQTSSASTSEIGTARRDVSPASSMSPALVLSAEENKREKVASKTLEAMKSSLKSNKSIPLRAEDLDLYGQALIDPKATSARISTKNFRSHASNHMDRLLDILAAAPHLRELVFEDPLDFVATEGAGKADVKISLGEMIEKLTGSKSLQTVSFYGLPEGDQLNDFIYNFKAFIRKDQARQFTVIFREVSPKNSGGGATTLKSTFGERVVLKMKE